MDNVSAERSMLLTDEDALEGQTLISVETCSDFVEDSGILNFVEGHIEAFMKYIRVLPRKDQDLLLSYYLVHKTQTQLGPLFGMTQTVCSGQLRLAVRALVATIMFAGHPSASQMRPILLAAGCEERTIPGLRGAPIPMLMSNLVAEYVESRSFHVLAERHGLHRPDIRRNFVAIAATMIESLQPEQRAMGSYVELMVTKMSPSGSGYTKRATLKLGDVSRRDSDILLTNVLDVTHDDFAEWFASKANL